MFELEPVNPYTSEDLDWTDDDSRVTVEHENESERVVELVSATAGNWNEYDTVYVGYPIWWGIASWVVDDFVTENDFTVKTVIPFCTFASSDLGEKGSQISADTYASEDMIELYIAANDVNSESAFIPTFEKNKKLAAAVINLTTTAAFSYIKLKSDNLS